jgi:hypothetical protein
MLTTPRIVERAEQPYAAIKAQVGVRELGSTGPELHRELRRWLRAHAIEPAGPPFFKYNLIDMARGFEMEFGFRPRASSPPMSASLPRPCRPDDTAAWSSADPTRSFALPIPLWSIGARKRASPGT